MEARRLRCGTLAPALTLSCVIGVGLLTTAGQAATFQTRNFSVTAENAQVAEQVGQKAEEYRRTLAVFWLGQPLPNWSSPCKLKVREGAMGAGGQTTFQFVRGEVLNWNMFVQGSLERILDSVLPHEINHTIFACHFRRPLPRWADEGAATLFEHKSEQLKQLALLNDVISSDRERFSLRQLLVMKEYPEGMRPMLILYAQGYALADFLVQQRGRQGYLKFLTDGEKLGWEQAIRTNFDHEGIESLEKNWRGWVLAGMPHLTTPKPAMQLADTATDERSAAMPAEWGAVAETAAVVRQPAVVTPQLPRDTTIRSQSMDSWSETAEDSAKSASPDIPANQSSSIPAVNSDQLRRFTIQAPAPAPTQSTPANFESGRIGLAATSSTLTGDADPGWRSSLEPTGLSSGQSNPQDRSDIQPVVTEFPGVPLPSERNVVSGSLPQWAGFPGQKKLF